MNTFQATSFIVEENSRTFQGKMEFKDFSRTSPKTQGLFKTVQTPNTSKTYCSKAPLYCDLT